MASNLLSIGRIPVVDTSWPRNFKKYQKKKQLKALVSAGAAQLEKDWIQMFKVIGESSTENRNIIEIDK